MCHARCPRASNLSPCLKPTTARFWQGRSLTRVERAAQAAWDVLRRKTWLVSLCGIEKLQDDSAADTKMVRHAKCERESGHLCTRLADILRAKDLFRGAQRGLRFQAGQRDA